MTDENARCQEIAAAGAALARAWRPLTDDDLHRLSVIMAPPVAEKDAA